MRDFIAIGNDELGEPLRDTHLCVCGAYHIIRSCTGTTSDGKPTDLTLQVYDCGGSTYLIGVKGRSIGDRRRKET